MAANNRALIALLSRMVEDYEIPRLSSYGFRKEELEVIANRSSLKDTPVELSRNNLMTILEGRL